MQQKNNLSFKLIFIHTISNTLLYLQSFKISHDQRRSEKENREVLFGATLFVFFFLYYTESDRVVDYFVFVLFLRLPKRKK